MPTTEETVARKGLRALAPNEEGESFAKLPAGVYGFTYAPLTESPLFSKHDYHCYEMRRTAQGAGSLVAFVTAEEAKHFAAGDAYQDIYVYPASYGEATTAIEIPVERVKRRNRNPIREEGNRLAVTIAPKS